MTAPPDAPAEQPPRRPFWGYADVFLFLGLALPTMLLGAALLKALFVLAGVHVGNPVFVLLPGQFLGYAFLFGFLWLLFRYQHKQPFWRSLGWVDSGVSAWLTAWAGVGLAIAVALAAILLRTPEIDSPMREYLSSGRSLALVALFGITLGPLAEELAFRGFMQPLFVKSFGAPAGIALAALPFGLAHLQQYGWSWRHGLLITLAGCAFGWARHRTGSTRAAVVMHIAYNLTFVLALLAQGRELPGTW